MFNDPRLIKEKPVLAAMLMLPFLKGSNSVLTSAAMKLAKSDSALASALGKSLTPGATLKGRGTKLGDWMRVAEPEVPGVKRTGPPGSRQMTLGDVASGVGSGALLGTAFGVPEVGAVYGAGATGVRGALTAKKAREGDRYQSPAQSQARTAEAGAAVEGLDPAITGAIIDPEARTADLPVGPVKGTTRRVDVEAGSSQAARGQLETGDLVEPYKAEVTQVPSEDFVSGLTPAERQGMGPEVAGRIERIKAAVKKSSWYRAPDPYRPGRDIAFEPLRLVDDAERVDATFVESQLEVAKKYINDEIDRRMQQEASLDPRVQLPPGRDVPTALPGPTREMILADLAGEYQVSTAVVRRFESIDAETLGDMYPDEGGAGVSTKLNQTELMNKIAEVLVVDLGDAVPNGGALKHIPGKSLQIVEGPRHQAFELLFGENTAPYNWQGRPVKRTGPEGKLGKELRERGYSINEMWDSVNKDGSIPRESLLADLILGKLTPRAAFEARREAGRPKPPTERPNETLRQQEKRSRDEFMPDENLDPDTFPEFPHQGDWNLGTAARGADKSIESIAGEELSSYMRNRAVPGSEEYLIQAAETLPEGMRTSAELQKMIDQLPEVRRKLLLQAWKKRGYRQKDKKLVESGMEELTASLLADQQRALLREEALAGEIVGSRSVPRRGAQPRVRKKGESLARARYNEGVEAGYIDPKKSPFHEPFSKESHPAIDFDNARNAGNLIEAETVLPSVNEWVWVGKADRMADLKVTRPVLNKKLEQILDDAYIVEITPEMAAEYSIPGMDAMPLYQKGMDAANVSGGAIAAPARRSVHETVPGLEPGYVVYSRKYNALIPNLFIPKVEAPVVAKVQGEILKGPVQFKTKMSLSDFEALSTPKIDAPVPSEAGLSVALQKAKAGNGDTGFAISSYPKEYNPKVFEGIPFDEGAVTGKDPIIRNLPGQTQAAIRFARELTRNPEGAIAAYESIAYHRGQHGAKVKNQKGAEASWKSRQEELQIYDDFLKAEREKKNFREELKKEILRHIPTVQKRRKAKELFQDLEDLNNYRDQLVLEITALESADKIGSLSLSESAGLNTKRAQLEQLDIAASDLARKRDRAATAAIEADPARLETLKLLKLRALEESAPIFDRPAKPKAAELKAMRERAENNTKARQEAERGAFETEADYLAHQAAAMPGTGYKPFKPSTYIVSNWIGGTAIYAGPRVTKAASKGKKGKKPADAKPETVNSLPKKRLGQAWKEYKERPADKKGKPPKVGSRWTFKAKKQDKPKSKYEETPEWTVGDSKVQVDRWGNLWRDEGAYNDLTRIKNKKTWIDNPTAISTAAESRAMRISLGEFLSQSVRRGLAEGDYDGSIAALNYLRAQIVNAIRDQNNQPGSSSFKTKAHKRAHQQEYFVETNLAKTVTHADLAAYVESIDGFKKQVYDAAYRGIRVVDGKRTSSNTQPRLRQLASKLKEQPFVRKLLRAPLPIIERVHRDLVKEHFPSIKQKKSHSDVVGKSLDNKIKGLSRDEAHVLERLLKDRLKDEEYQPQRDIFDANSAYLEMREKVAQLNGRQARMAEAQTPEAVDASIRDLIKYKSSLDSGLTMDHVNTSFQEFMSRTRKDKAWLESLEPVETVTVTRDGVRTNVPVRPSETVKVTPFLKTAVAKASKTIEKYTGINTGDFNTVMGTVLKDVFDSGYGLLSSDLLRGAVKEHLLKRVRKDLSDAIGVKESSKVIDGLLEKTSEALDVAFQDFDRPYRVRDLGDVKDFQIKEPPAIRVKLSQNVTKTYDLVEFFDTALREAKKEKDGKYNVQGIQVQASQKIVQHLADEVRQATLFNDLVNHWERIGIREGQVEVLLENQALLAKTKDLDDIGLLPDEINESLDTMGDSVVESVFGRWTNPPPGLPFSREALKVFRMRLGNNKSRVLEVIEKARKEKLSPKEKKRLVGDETGEVIAPDSQVGRYIQWLDEFSVLGDIRPGRSWIADKLPLQKTTKTLSQTQQELSQFQSLIFQEDTVFDRAQKQNMRSDVLVSPEWNEMQGYEIAARNDITSLYKTLNLNEFQMKLTLQAMHRFAKGSLTTMNPVTHVGNFMSNVTAVSMLTGETPVEVTYRAVTSAASYVQFSKLKNAADPAALSAWQKKYPKLYDAYQTLDAMGFEMRGIVEQELAAFGGFLDDANIRKWVKENVGELGKEPVKPGMIRRFMSFGVKQTAKVRGGAMKLYNLEDIAFRISEFVRENAELESGMSQISEGYHLDLRTGPNSITRFVKGKGDNWLMYKKGKLAKMTPEELQIRKGRAVMRKVNKVIFDYSDIPNFVRWMRDMPLSSFISPFITWAYKSLDVPLVKRGLIAETLFAEPAWTTNDPGVMAAQGRKTFAKDARRSMLLGSLLSQRSEEERIAGRLGRYLAEPLGLDGSLIELTGDPRFYNVVRTSNADPYSTSMSLVRNVSGLVGSYLIKDPLVTKEEMKKLGPLDRQRQLLRKAAMTGYSLNSRELKSLLYMGGSPVGQVMFTLVYGRPVGRGGEWTVGDILKPLGEMVVGPYVYKQTGNLINLLLNPGGESGILNEIFPSRLRYLKQEASRNRPFERDEEIRGALDWWLDNIFLLGRRRVDAAKRNADILREEKDKIIKSALAEFTKNAELLSETEAVNLNEDTEHLRMIITDHLDTRQALYEDVALKMSLENQRKGKAVQRGKFKAGKVVGSKFERTLNEQ